jgi:hypothetical protein
MCIFYGSMLRGIQDNIWAVQCLSDWNGVGVLAISDFRFKCEYETCKRMWPKVRIVTVLVVRNVESNANEMELDDFTFDYCIDNTHDLSTTYAQLDQLMMVLVSPLKEGCGSPDVLKQVVPIDPMA